ncbi:recombinase family protein, partial [Hyphomonas sp.]|uniref:recombinase family protein n=1 Tax=Hyphomonas sp. TaxID=87 RepID=UPI00260BA134
MTVTGDKGSKRRRTENSVRRCAVYTRKSTEDGLDQDFNSLHAQREACEAYVRSQAGEGWKLLPDLYDDGGFSGGTMDRPALARLLADIEAQKIDTIIVYKVDRLTRSLADFSRIVDVLDAHDVSFVSITQQFNTTTSMGRLTLNMLLSFAQFEREVTGERIRDKIAASKRKGMWMGGFVPLGYEPDGRTLTINEEEAGTVRKVFELYLELGNVRHVKQAADDLGLTTKVRRRGVGESEDKAEGPIENDAPASKRSGGGRPLSRGYIYKLLGNPLYIGCIAHKGEIHEGLHPAIIDLTT